MAIYLRSPHLNRFITLPRPYPDRPLRVSYAEVGSPTGRPVLLFLGLGCVRYLVALFDDLGRAFNLRLICIDRWGLGKTDNVPQEQRSLTQWGLVVEKVLDQLGIDGFQVVAHSAGAPYACAVALQMRGRVKGKLHFLAPWVNSEIDGGEFQWSGFSSILMASPGYKWLKWVPNGVIKSAVAAEWRLQSYILGKPPPLTYKPVGYDAPAQGLRDSPTGDARTRRSSNDQPSPARMPEFMRRASHILVKHESSVSGTLSSPSNPHLERSPRVKNLKSIATLRSHSDNSIPSRASLASVRTPSPSISSASVTFLQSPADPPADISADFGLGEGFDTFGTDLRLAISEPSSSDRSKPPTGPALTLALMQASHAESEPGTTADLLSIVLGRDARPWGFSYADMPQPCRIWWGAEDDKVSEKSMRWLERCMGAELKVVQGEGHNLMTCAGVMVEVFESLARDARELG